MRHISTVTISLWNLIIVNTRLSLICLQCCIQRHSSMQSKSDQNSSLIYNISEEKFLLLPFKQEDYTSMYLVLPNCIKIMNYYIKLCSVVIIMHNNNNNNNLSIIILYIIITRQQTAQ